MRRTLSLAITLLLVGACAPTNSTDSLPVEVLVALDQGEARLLLIPVDSPSVQREVALGNVGGFPISLATFGDRAVVGFTSSRLVVVDLASRAVIPPAIDLGVVPEAVAFLDGKTAFAAGRNFQTVNRLNIESGTITSSTVRGGTGGFALARGKLFAVVPNRVGCSSLPPEECPGGPSWLSEVSPGTQADSIGLSGPGNAAPAVLGPDGLLYVLAKGDGGAEEGRLSVVDPVRGRETVAYGGFGVAPELLATDGTERILVASAAGGLMVFNTRLNRVTLPFGGGVPLDGPTALVADAAGRVYVVERGGCTAQLPGRIRVFSGSLVERPAIAAGVCPVAAAIAEVAADRLFDTP